MVSQVLLSIFLIAAISTAAVRAVPAICQYINCPTFIASDQTASPSERVYAVEKWVATDGDVTKMDQSRVFMLQRLLAYFGGANVEGQKLNITLPFLTKIVRNPNSNITTHISMYMFIPTASQSSPPTPTDQLVRVIQTPVSRVYSRSFGGWTTRPLIKKVRQELSQVIGNANLYDDSHFYIATYSGPLQWFNRYNELWLVKKGF